MMFESLTDKLQGIFERLRGKGRLDEKTVDEVLREIRLALLEADVNFRVVKEFIVRIREKAVGEEVLKSLTPDQQVIRIVRDELIALLERLRRTGCDLREIEVKRAERQLPEKLWKTLSAFANATG
ncbi:MAG: signal recognition particle receptor subunit alpha, partial [Fimbriimonadales bacterium]